MASFPARVTIVSAAAVALTVAAGSVVAYLAVRSELRGEVDRSLRERAGEVLRPGPGFELPAPLFGGAGGYVQLVPAEGPAIRRRGETVALPSDEAREVAAGRRDSFYEDVRLLDTHLRVYTTALAPGIAVQVARPLTEADRTLHRLGLILLGVSLGGIVLAAGLGLLVSRTALAPVRRLSAATAHVTATGDLTKRVDAPGSDELSRLAASFNAMLGALEESVTAQRRLVADASHELRTPLTSLRTNVEVLEREQELEPEERRRLLRDLVQQAEELSVLVADLVELARDGESAFEPEELRLDELVEAAVDRARLHSPHVRFSAELQPTVVHGAAERLDRAVANLLDNAAKWSPPGGTVEVEVRDGEVTIRDHGPGIDAADLPFVFERFYRAPAARGVPGSGLGLAIVRQVADAHGGSVTAEPAPGGGARLRLRVELSGSGS